MGAQSPCFTRARTQACRRESERRAEGRKGARESKRGGVGGQRTREENVRKREQRQGQTVGARGARKRNGVGARERESAKEIKRRAERAQERERNRTPGREGARNRTASWRESARKSKRWVEGARERERNTNSVGAREPRERAREKPNVGLQQHGAPYILFDSRGTSCRKEMRISCPAIRTACCNLTPTIIGMTCPQCPLLRTRRGSLHRHTRTFRQ
jgi:hypothetical protein